MLKRLNMTHLLYNQYITGTKILDIGGRVTHYKSVLPWLGPLRELDFGLFIAAISTVIKGVSRDSPWNSSAFVMEHDGTTTRSFCSGFPWDKATTEVTAAATRAVFGKEIEELSALQYAHYAACSGGVLPLLDASPGGAQEFKLLGLSKSARCSPSPFASFATATLLPYRKTVPASRCVPSTARTPSAPTLHAVSSLPRRHTSARRLNTPPRCLQASRSCCSTSRRAT